MPSMGTVTVTPSVGRPSSALSCRASARKVTSQPLWIVGGRAITGGYSGGSGTRLIRTWFDSGPAPKAFSAMA